MSDKNRFFTNQNTMNGLLNFIAELRECKQKELEDKRINKELYNIRYFLNLGGLNFGC